MSAVATRNFVTGATVVGGLLAGANVEKNVVQLPAWKHVGLDSWAAYSRKADLATGLFVYPTEGIGAAALTLAAAVSYALDRAAPKRAAVPIYTAAALVVGGLVATRFAAPALLSLRRVGDDPDAVSQAFRRFRAWGLLRGVMQTLAFGASVWALAALRRGEEEAGTAPRA